eukprot:Tbor_TRINITY_DN5272_c0_g1::TRINITY_DN5272_c0_g1_i1::g.16441::m.16441/K01835/pgm; phosphoglucomutase
MSISCRRVTVSTTPFKDQKPGTSGLRKKTRIFLENRNYLPNFVQSTFNVLKTYKDEFSFPSVLVIGGDGRFFGKEAVDIITKMAIANGVEHVWVGHNALISTPATSAIIRNRKLKGEQDMSSAVKKGAFILTASHNPGGIDEDFGIKYNDINGGPASEKLTDYIYKETLNIREYYTCDDGMILMTSERLGTPTTFKVSCEGGVCSKPQEIEVIDSIEDYTKLLCEDVFDIAALKDFFNNVAPKSFRIVLDAMNGVAGPYVVHIFEKILGLTKEQCTILNSEPKEDFGKGHPDPNLTYAKELVEIMGLQRDGTPLPGSDVKYGFGAAFDGDADRNMVLGNRFFITPSDSVAVLAAYADEAIPFFANRGGLKAVARSMPTSGALDHVAKAKGIILAEVPTGWKYFGNLMDAGEICRDGACTTNYSPMICGEESFGTGSNHIREKDGCWAVISWLSVLAYVNKKDKEEKKNEYTFVSVEDILRRHWATYGRNFYCRYDYEMLNTDDANGVISRVANLKPEEVPPLRNGNTTSACISIDNFCYTDPVDGETSKNQGLRVIFSDQSRFVLRLSGTGSAGATIRLYMEQYCPPSGMSDKGSLSTHDALKELVALTMQVTRIKELTGRSEPSVIT